MGGEPGIGKSRLADEVSSHARDRGFVALWGRGWEDAGAPPYWPWVQVLRSYVRQTDADTVRRSWGPAPSTSPRCFPRSTSSFRISKRHLLESPTRPAFSSSTRRRRSCVQRGSLARCIVVLDDLQAADPSSLRLLGFLASQLGDMRVLIIGTYRDVELSADHPLTIAMADLVRAPIDSHDQPERTGARCPAIAHRGNDRQCARRAARRGDGPRDQGQPTLRS